MDTMKIKDQSIRQITIGIKLVCSNKMALLYNIIVGIITISQIKANENNMIYALKNTQSKHTKTIDSIWDLMNGV